MTSITPRWSGERVAAKREERCFLCLKPYTFIVLHQAAINGARIAEKRCDDHPYTGPAELVLNLTRRTA